MKNICSERGTLLFKHNRAGNTTYFEDRSSDIVSHEMRLRFLFPDREVLIPYMKVSTLILNLEADLRTIRALRAMELSEEYSEEEIAKYGEEEIGSEILLDSGDYGIAAASLGTLEGYISNLICVLKKFVRPQGYENFKMEAEEAA